MNLQNHGFEPGLHVSFVKWICIHPKGDKTWVRQVENLRPDWGFGIRRPPRCPWSNKKVLGPDVAFWTLTRASKWLRPKSKFGWYSEFCIRCLIWDIWHRFWWLFGWINFLRSNLKKQNWRFGWLNLRVRNGEPLMNRMIFLNPKWLKVHTVKKI